MTATLEHTAITGTLRQELLNVRNLNVSFRAGRGRDARLTHVVKGVDLRLAAGECLAIVGESGSGKSVTARTLVGLPGGNASVQAERLELAGHRIGTLGERQWRRLRGKDIGFVLQDALVSLDPLRPVGKEIEE